MIGALQQKNQTIEEDILVLKRQSTSNLQETQGNKEIDHLLSDRQSLEDQVERLTTQLRCTEYQMSTMDKLLVQKEEQLVSLKHENHIVSNQLDQLNKTLFNKTESLEEKHQLLLEQKLMKLTDDHERNVKHQIEDCFQRELTLNNRVIDLQRELQQIKKDLENHVKIN